ncbi:unnamed protein product [Acanthoscelides obtectus]|uniref:Platelet-derived growth factor (PDGF) family profile domain-containing protein n=1 Tax=Acanthoscelides obtectus TaxID=200917 RepID=A0A9P0PR93_ACAOB|nr:unnamed protein product [Acanthoscelides obtectus]CAK1664944.1 Vascular endothelial growth factor homolog [Acanthoscelides obtectus]
MIRRLRAALIFICLFVFVCVKEGRREIQFDCEAVMPCKAPQPRAYRISELLGRDQLVSFKPNMVILHRCDNSGCCNDKTLICLPLNTEEVNMSYYYLGRLRYRYFINHTECSCQMTREIQEKTRSIKR